MKPHTLEVTVDMMARKTIRVQVTDYEITEDYDDEYGRCNDYCYDNCDLDKAVDRDTIIEKLNADGWEVYDFDVRIG